MFKNWLCLLLAFLFFSNDAFAVITGGSAGAPTASAGPAPYVESDEDVIRRCSEALTAKFGEIKEVSVLNGCIMGGGFSYTVWCQIRDDECQLFHINGSAEAGVSLKLLQPEGPELYFTEYKPYEKIMQFRAKNPEKTDEILCWEFDYTNWKSISEDDWIYSHDEHMQKIQALYPGHICDIKRVEKEKVLTFLTDPVNLAVKRAIVFRRLQTAVCEQTELFTASTDSIRTDGLLVNYKGIDGNPYAKKINLEAN